MSTEITPIEGVRHSLAHLLAATVIEMYPGVKNAIGPAIENGFYQDFDTPMPIGEDELPKIEAKMREKLKTWAEFQRREVTADEAREQFAWNPYKLELIDDLERQGDKEITFYTSGDFIDLCKGGHVDDATKINPNAFKLTKVSGAYWRGDQNKQQLQRIYGVAFATEEELKEYLVRLEEAKQRDHRKLGKELDLYTMSPLVGAGLPLFTPRGTVLRDLVSAYANQLRQARGFQKVSIPHITKKELYETSGHWAKFGDELFLVTSQETSDDFVLKPMNCPHHTQIFASQPRSYRDLPIRYLDTTMVYRDEKTGELGGLSRVRSITQDDAHAFVRSDQIESQINDLLSAANELYGTLNMRLRVRLSYRDDSDAYLGERALWESAQTQLKAAVEANGLDYFEQEGEAAFYGPKIDFMATDAIGREHQVATVQLDFVMPQRFGLEYTGTDGESEHPVLIHCALLGSIERFLSVFVEHTAGWFPFWAAPEQIRILTINDTVLDYVSEIKQMLSEAVLMQPVKYNELRFTVDDRNESLSKKIREAATWKIPVQLIVGPKDKEAREVSVRTQTGEEKIALDQLGEYLQNIA
jgi:threonyl-tRNA synthetase